MDASGLEPVLFLTGAGLSAAVALRAIAAVESQVRVLSAPLVLADAEDDGEDLAYIAVRRALGVLDRAEIEQAHIVGLSYGGVPAQELAIRHPERVRSLVLAGTSAGGDRFRRPERPVRDFMRRVSRLPAEEGLWASVPYLYATSTWRNRARLIGEDIARRLRDPVEPQLFDRQYASARAHDASARLGEISSPTLVFHGEQDRVVPLENGRLLAEGIRDARFVALPGAAHALDVGEAGRELVSFLQTHSRRRPGAARKRNGRASRA